MNGLNGSQDGLQADRVDGNADAQATGTNMTVRGRREVLLGGLALGAFLISGCSTRQSSSGSGSYTVSNAPSGGYGHKPIYGPGTAPSPVVQGRSAPMPSPAMQTGESVSILPRSVWTRQGVARPRECYDMNGVSRITVHHSAMDSSGLRSQSDVVGQIESIRATHVRNGWADIGYHYVIDPQGRVYEARPAWKQGAHVKDQNEHNLGVMLMGNFEHQQPTSDSINSLRRMVAMQMRKYRVPLNRVYTHREIGKSACPGRVLQGNMVAMRSRNGALAMAVADIPGLA